MPLKSSFHELNQEVQPSMYGQKGRSRSCRHALHTHPHTVFAVSVSHSIFHMEIYKL